MMVSWVFYHRMRHRFFLVAVFLLAGLLTIGILATAKAFPSTERVQTALTWQYAFVVVIGATIFLGLFRRFRSRILWEVLFTVTLFLGVWFAMLLVLPLSWGLAIAAVLTLAQILLRRVWIHDLFYLVGAAGVSIDFAGWLLPEMLLLGLVAFTVYDMVAGPPGGPIASLAGTLVQKGIVPGFVIPSRVAELRMTVDEVVKSRAALLGAGDLILPLSLVARAAFAGPIPAAIVLAGLLVGALIVVKKSDVHPRAALPALATGAALPFLVLRLLSVI